MFQFSIRSICSSWKVLELSRSGIGFLEETELPGPILFNQGLREVAQERFLLSRALGSFVPEEVEGEGLVKVPLLDKGLVCTHENFVRPETGAPGMGNNFPVFWSLQLWVGRPYEWSQQCFWVARPGGTEHLSMFYFWI